MSNAIDLLAQAVKDAGLVMTLSGRVVTADELKRRAFERAVERLAQSTGASEEQARADAPAGLNDRRGSDWDERTATTGGVPNEVLALRRGK